MSHGLCYNVLEYSSRFGMWHVVFWLLTMLHVLLFFSNRWGNSKTKRNLSFTASPISPRTPSPSKRLITTVVQMSTWSAQKSHQAKVAQNETDGQLQWDAPQTHPSIPLLNLQPPFLSLFPSLNATSLRNKYYLPHFTSNIPKHKCHIFPR